MPLVYLPHFTTCTIKFMYTEKSLKKKSPKFMEVIWAHIHIQTSSSALLCWSAYISGNEGRQIDSGRQSSNWSEAVMQPCSCVKFIVEGVLKSNLILILTDLTVRFNYELKHLDTDRLKCTPTHTHPHREAHTVWCFVASGRNSTHLLRGRQIQVELPHSRELATSFILHSSSWPGLPLTLWSFQFCFLHPVFNY